MHKKVRKRVLYHRFQKGTSSLSELISTGVYKRKLNDLAKNNRSLALALQDARCESSCQREILKDYMEDCNKVRFARIKLKTMASTIQRLITDLDEVTRHLDIDITEKHRQFLEVIQKDSSPSSEIRMKFWDPAVSCIEEASALSLESDAIKEVVDSLHVVKSVGDKDCNPAVETFPVLLDHPILFCDDSGGLDQNERGKIKNKQTCTMSQYSQMPESRKSSGRREVQSFNRNSRKDIPEKKNSTKRTESLSMNTGVYEEGNDSFVESKNELGKHDSVMPLTPQLILPNSRKKSSYTKKIQCSRKNSKRRFSEKNSSRVSELLLMDKEASEMERNSSGEIQNDCRKLAMKMSTTPKINFACSENFNNKNIMLPCNSKSGENERKHSLKKKNTSTVPVETSTEPVVCSALIPNISENWKPLSENVASISGLENNNHIKKTEKEQFETMFNEVDAQSQTILVPEDMELTDVFPILVKNKINNSFLREKNGLIIANSEGQVQGSDMQSYTNMFPINNIEETKFCHSNSLNLIHDSEAECLKNVALNSVHSRVSTEAVNNTQCVVSSLSSLNEMEHSKAQRRSSSKTNENRASSKKYPKAKKSSILTQSDATVQNNSICNNYPPVAIGHTLENDAENVISIRHQSSKKPFEDDNVERKISSAIIETSENKNSKDLVSGNKTPTTACRRSARVKSNIQYSLYFSSEHSFESGQNQKRSSSSPDGYTKLKKQKKLVSESLSTHDTISSHVQESVYDFDFTDSTARGSCADFKSKSRKKVESDYKLQIKSHKGNGKHLQSSKIVKPFNQEPQLLKSALVDIVQDEEVSANRFPPSSKKGFNEQLPALLNENECESKLIKKDSHNKVSLSVEERKMPVSQVRSVSFAPMDLICNFEKSSIAKDIAEKRKTECISKSNCNFSINLDKTNQTNGVKNILAGDNHVDSGPCEKLNPYDVTKNEQSQQMKISIPHSNKLVSNIKENQNGICLISPYKSKLISEQSIKHTEICEDQNLLEFDIHFNNSEFFDETEIYTHIPLENQFEKESRKNEQVSEEQSLLSAHNDIIKNLDINQSQDLGKQNDVAVTKEQNLSKQNKKNSPCKISRKSSRVKDKTIAISENQDKSNTDDAIVQRNKNCDKNCKKESLTSIGKPSKSKTKKCTIDPLDIFDEANTSNLFEPLMTKSNSCPVKALECRVTTRKKLKDSPVLKEVANLPHRKTLNESMLKSNQRGMQISEGNELDSKVGRRQRKPVSYKLPRLNMKMRRP